MMKVIGEEGTSLKDYTEYLKGEFFDAVYLQQNAFDPVDEACSAQRQEYVFKFLVQILQADFAFDGKDSALQFFSRCASYSRDGIQPFESEEFKKIENEITILFTQKRIPTKEAVSA